jgi:hypothetical protein
MHHRVIFPFPRTRLSGRGIAKIIPLGFDKEGRRTERKIRVRQDFADR